MHPVLRLKGSSTVRMDSLEQIFEQADFQRVNFQLILSGFIQEPVNNRRKSLVVAYKDDLLAVDTWEKRFRRRCSPASSIMTQSNDKSHWYKG